MDITGIICEYNPLHIGHKKQIDHLKTQFPDGGIVCLMSGNFVQRGQPALFHKSLRAQAAIQCGADLVLELPVTGALSSAEGFASEGVRILGDFCHRLCFGAENADKAQLLQVAQALLAPEFSGHLADKLQTGVSFPVARQRALEDMGVDGSILSQPNNILAVEYCKGILTKNSPMLPYPIYRPGNYHEKKADGDNPSATAVRDLMLSGGNWGEFVPEMARDIFSGGEMHTLAAGERAILARLRTMTEEEFAALPYGSEGLWRKLMHTAGREASLEGILTAVKSKRYTRTRLDRMVMCAFLGLTEADMRRPAPYTRVLAFNDRGREILKAARMSGEFVNIGEKTGDPYEVIESRTGSLYGLFAEGSVGAPDAEENCRVFYSVKKDLPQRKPVRIPDYDYATPGAYFITFCIDGRKPILWNVGAATCRPNSATENVGAATCRPPLSPVGRIVETAILQVPKHYPAVSVDKYCVMPDHIHMILSINTDEDGRQIAAPTVSSVVGHMKRWVSMQIGQSIWQKSFIDRVIRNDKGYRAVWEYIENNPIKLDTAYDMPDFENM